MKFIPILSIALAVASTILGVCTLIRAPKYWLDLKNNVIEAFEIFYKLVIGSFTGLILTIIILIWVLKDCLL